MAVLVVTEKPSVAQSIAHVVGAGGRKDGYMAVSYTHLLISSPRFLIM